MPPDNDGLSVSTAALARNAADLLDSQRADIFAARAAQTELKIEFAQLMVRAQEAEEAATLRYFEAVTQVYGYGRQLAA